MKQVTIKDIKALMELHPPTTHKSLMPFQNIAVWCIELRELRLIKDDEQFPIGELWPYELWAVFAK